jgi:DNA-binding CsgD family transcriptional regulator
MPEKLFSVLPDIYDAAMQGDRWQKALDGLSEVLGARGTILMAYDLVETPFQMNSWSSLYTVEELREYSARFSHYEAEIAAYTRHIPPRQLGRDIDIWPEIEHDASRDDLIYLRDRFGIYHRSGAKLNVHGAWKDFITVQVGREWKDVPPSFERTLDLAIPHLAKAVEIGRTFSLLYARYRAVLAALDNIGVGMCIATGNGWIAVSNEEARRIFSAGNGLSVAKDGRLMARDEDITRQIRQGIELVALTASGAGNIDEITISCPRLSGGTPFLIEICPLRDSGSDLEAHFAGSLICIIDPDQASEISTIGMAKIYGLSFAETAVCDALIRGRTGAEIAEMRNVSTETVRSQVRAIYTKANVSSRIELIRLALLVNPPIR